MSKTHRYAVGHKFKDKYGVAEVLALRNGINAQALPQYKIREGNGAVTYADEAYINEMEALEFGVTFIAEAPKSDDNPQVAKFKAITNEMVATYEKKNHDYGNAYEAGFRLFGHNQLLSRIYEKFMRVHNLLGGSDRKVGDETITQTLTDMANQCICLRMLLEADEFENVQ